MRHEHHRWLEEASKSIQNDWNEQRELSVNPSRIQEVGHNHETAWLKFLKKWLPPHYEVATRKYIVGTNENDQRPFETDLVIFRPGYPKGLREETYVMASGVAAAFSVKLTLKPSGLSEAAQSSSRLQKSLVPQLGHARQELWKPFLYGVLSGSHDWKQPSSKPLDNMTSLLSDNDDDKAQHPAESIDLVCVADLGVWSKSLSYMPSVPQQPEVETIMTSHGHVRCENVTPVTTFLSCLYERLSWQDEDLKSIAYDFRITGQWEGSSGFQRLWRATDELTPDALREIRSNPWNGPANGLDSWHQRLD